MSRLAMPGMGAIAGMYAGGSIGVAVEGAEGSDSPGIVGGTIGMSVGAIVGGLLGWTLGQ